MTVCPARLAAVDLARGPLNVKALSADPIAGRRVATLRPEVVRVTMARWRDSGAGVSVVSGRFRVLRSAVGWAQAESIIDRNPLRDMRGPPRPGTRMHVPEQDVLALLRMSEVLVEKADAAFDGSVGSRKSLEATWHRRANGVPFGEWVFSRDIDHQRRLTAGALGHWFAELCAEADLVGVSLHRLRHSVATFLVGRGEILRAQHRLGHRDPSTTLRNYAHALPLEDGEVADDIDVMLGAVVASESTSLPSPTAAAGPSLPHGSGASASVFSDSGSFFDSINPPIVSRPTSI